MIDQIDQRLENWVKSVLKDASVSLDAPKAPENGTQINLYLLEILPTPAARTVKDAPPHKVKLRYLVTAWAPDSRKMHGALAALLGSAFENNELEVDPEPVPAAVWQSLGLPMRPAFSVRVPLAWPRPVRKVPMVRSQLILRHSPMRALTGQVFGPGNIAIMGAMIELPSLSLMTHTDHHGRFRFPAVPSEPPVHLLRINAKGSVISVQPEEPPSPGEPLIIHLNENQI